MKRSARSSARNPLDRASGSEEDNLRSREYAGGDGGTHARSRMPLERGESGSAQRRGGAACGEILLRVCSNGEKSLSSELDARLVGCES